MTRAHHRKQPRDSGDSLEALCAIKKRVLKGYPDVTLARKRTALVGVLLKLADQLAAGFSKLAAMPIPAGPDSTPPFLKADRPIATLRAYRVELLDMLCKGLTGADKDPEVAELRARLTTGPGPGGELIDAGDLLVWFVQWYLFIQLQVEATSTRGLPSHDVDTHVDEAARAEISMAKKDMALANMRVLIGEDNLDCGELSPNGLAHRVGRRRRGIDVLRGAFCGSFQEAVEQQIRAVTACCGENSPEAKDLQALRRNLDDPNDPKTRSLFQQWMTVVEHLETADPEKLTLVQDGTASGPVDSS
jgi:hypothetical protein